jgi:hypothetical protein
MSIHLCVIWIKTAEVKTKLTEVDFKGNYYRVNFSDGRIN